MVTVWKSYGKAVIGTMCPVFGGFSADGNLYPSSSFAEVAAIQTDVTEGEINLPKLLIADIATECKITEAFVL